MHPARRTNAPHRAHLTPKMALELAAPHTWPAAIMPTLVALAAAAHPEASLSAVMAVVLLAIVVLFQSAANTFNDYYDFVKGTDAPEHNVEASDAVLVYNDVDPKSALHLAVGFVVCAFVLGLYVVWHAGFVPLALGIIGAAFVVLYSAGKTPLSYLPLGEAASGIVMGGIVPIAVYQALTGTIDARAMVCAIPTVITVGLIMLTNNTCDIERDTDAARKTLPLILGRAQARRLYRALLFLAVAGATGIVIAFFTPGAALLPFMLLALQPFVGALVRNPLTPDRRVQAMSQVLTVNVVLGAFYAAAMVAGSYSLFTG